jgi:hypothetical protein
MEAVLESTLSAKATRPTPRVLGPQAGRPGEASRQGDQVTLGWDRATPPTPRVLGPPARPPEEAAEQGDLVTLGSDQAMPPALEKVAGRDYYDAARDAADRERYYAGLGAEDLDPAEFFRRLSKLVSRTHTHKLGYHPERYLFPWVDLRPSLRLQSLYSGRPVRVDEPVRILKPEDLVEKVLLPPTPSSPGKARRARRSLEREAAEWVQALSQGPTDAVALARRIAEIETRSYFNCEHVVPRVWFGGSRPMEGDLHHLFTCQSQCNEERGSRKLLDFPHYDGAEAACGQADDQVYEFEPAAGKGPAARAILYFLLRYPQKIGWGQGEYRPEDLETLLAWHEQYPVTLYERHRNQAIFALQGNRNPLIDHPEWARRIDFRLGLARPLRLPSPSRPGSPPPWRRGWRERPR